MPANEPTPAETTPGPGHDTWRWQQRQQKWQSLVAESAAGTEQLEADCRAIERELADAEAARIRAETEYLRSSAALAARMDSTHEATAEPDPLGGSGAWRAFAGCA